MRILIADDKNTVRYGLSVLLEEQDDVEIISEVVDFRELIQAIQVECPDLILLSWELPGMAGENLMYTMRLICPEVHIVVMSIQNKVAESAMNAGADNFVCKAEPPERLLEVVREYIGVERPW